MNNKYKAVVFDFGGVIEVWKGGDILKDIADSINVPVAEFKDEYFKHNHLSNVENIPWEEMILKVVSVFTSSQAAFDKTQSIVDDYQSKKVINTELVSFFGVLRKQGYQVAIFSNATSHLREKLQKKGLLDLVDDVIVSGEIGFQKPHQEAFEVLFKKLSVKPEEVVFIDDAKKSLEKATEIGYTPILFQGNGKLKEDLKGLGISL